jgi:Zn ribbon nucleic-acid-binding protein
MSDPAMTIDENAPPPPSFLDYSRQRVRELGIAENYECVACGWGIGADDKKMPEEVRCFACGFFKRRGNDTLSAIWKATNPATTPGFLELCKFCNQAASEPS